MVSGLKTKGETEEFDVSRAFHTLEVLGWILDCGRHDLGGWVGKGRKISLTDGRTVYVGPYSTELLAKQALVEYIFKGF